MRVDPRHPVIAPHTSRY